MSHLDEKKDGHLVGVEGVEVTRPDMNDHERPNESELEHKLDVTKDDLLDAEERINSMPLDRCKRILSQIAEMHKYDQNFPVATLERIDRLLHDPEVTNNPKDNAELIYAMKVEALLATENSPYAEVRAVVDPTDDPSLQSLTLRSWIIGIFFAGAGAFINQLFSIRQPPVMVTSPVAQLLAWPVGKLFERTMPDWGFNWFGTRCSLNPGPFNRKEHMLITIMATVAFNTPYTGYIVFVQAMPFFFNQEFARHFGYQILNSLGSNFVGFGLAGLCRRFIVYPSFCVWPSSLTSLAINKAFHTDDSTPVKGPLGRTYSWSRMTVFLVAFCTMFAYWWFPGFIFQALSTFDWMTWIAPNNANLANITSMATGLGFSPIATWDFNNLMFNGFTPMVIPLFSVMNQFLGMIIGFIMIVAFYYTNAFHTSYLPINSNHTFDHQAKPFNVSNVINSEAHFDLEKYQAYSEPYMSAGNLVVYFWFFAIYTATLSYTGLYHRHELVHGFKGCWRAVKAAISRKPEEETHEDDLAEDIHWRLMRRYKEVPEWWYFIILCVALVVGCVGVGVYPTNVTPAVVIYGIIMALIFVVPVGLIYAVTGVQVTMNVLAEFIGGSMVPGNALAMNYFKMYGYICTAQAIYFSNDLKLAHYVKIPPRCTFTAQVVATLVSTFICVAIFNFQMGFRDVCTDNAAFGFTCPGEYTFFTASVFWGTIGPKRVFGAGGHYSTLLIGFPVGFVLPFITFYLAKWFPRVQWLRSLHPVMICAGSLMWAPYNFGYFIPTVYLSLFSWQYLKKKHLDFWSRYNYIIAGAWVAAIAIAAIVIFFGVQIPEKSIDWWGNDAQSGCNAKACVRFTLPEGEYFGPEPGHYN